MATVNIVDKKARMTRWDIVKFQLITHCYLNKLDITDSDFECLTLLSMNSSVELHDFCNAACNTSKRDREVTLTYTKEIFKSPQTVRNCLSKLERTGLIVKEGSNRKKILINPILKIQHSGNILLDFKLMHIGTQEK